MSEATGELPGHIKTAKRPQAIKVPNSLSAHGQMRRKVLVGIAATLASIATAGVAVNQIGNKPTAAEAGAPIDPRLPKNQRMGLGNPTETPVPPPTATATPKPTETPQIQKESFADFVKNNPLFKNYSEKEKNDLTQLATEQIGVLGGLEGSKEYTTRVIKLKADVENSWNKLQRFLPYSPNELTPKLLPAIILIESWGDPSAQSTMKVDDPKTGKKKEVVIAQGLCQLKEMTAQDDLEFLQRYATNDEIRRLGIKLPLNLLDPQTNIVLGLTHLSRVLNSYPEAGLAVWTYHMGEGNMQNVVINYLDKNLFLLPKYIDSKLSNLPPKPPGTAELVAGNSLNFQKIYGSKYAEWRKINELDVDIQETEVYFPRFLAASWILDQREKTEKRNKA